MTAKLAFSTLLATLLSMSACKGADTAKKDPIDPVCRTAEAISPGTRLSAATDEATPRFALKVRGPGELAVAGFVHKHNVRILQAATGEAAAEATTNVCTPSYVPLPGDSYGEYCVILEPLEKRGFSTFDLDYSTDKHERVPAEQSAKLCGAAK